jgi:signal transduction histidine kinase
MSDDEHTDRYYRVIRLSNGERVGIECRLASSLTSTSPTKENFVMHLLQGHGRIYGVWVFGRESFAKSEYQVRFARTHAHNSPQLDPQLHTRYDAEQSEDKAVYKELARRAGMAIDNARLWREAYNANHAKDHFLAALSHELRTPLTPAVLLSEALLGACGMAVVCLA